MATRRTTRRSTAVTNNNENSLAANGGLAAPAQPAKRQIAPKGKTLVNKTAAPSAAATTATTVAGASRKRVLGDVTNAAKAKVTDQSTTANNKSAFTKPQVGSSTTTRRTIRTRSSTGGSAAGLDDAPAGENRDDEEEDDDANSPPGDENAMVLDAPVVPASRQIKSNRRTTTASTKIATANTSNSTRAPLASKSTNATRTATASGRTAASKAASADKLKQMRERRILAEAAAAAATAELEAALKEEEEHAAKRMRTSEPDLEELDEEEEEEDDESTHEFDEGGNLIKFDKGGNVVNGVGEKDEGWEDLDLGDEEDPLMVSTYVVEVYEYMRELELTTMGDGDYMSRQNEVTWKMRGILIDWLVEIHTKFRLLPETIFLATNIIDRFLSVRVVSLVKFQLVGVTALFIASKYEEVVCPSVSNFLYMTDGGYEDDEILKAERYVLNMIDFNLSYPNPINFLRRISKADGYDITSRTIAKYLMEISIVDHHFVGITPSMIAAAGSWLARKALRKGAWDANLVHYSGYTEEELLPTAQLMLDYVVRSSVAPSPARGTANPLRLAATPVESDVEHPNFIKKYSGKKFFKASTFMRTWVEEEYGERNFQDPKTGKSELRQDYAIL